MRCSAPSVPDQMGFLSSFTGSLWLTLILLTDVSACSIFFVTSQKCFILSFQCFMTVNQFVPNNFISMFSVSVSSSPSNSAYAILTELFTFAMGPNLKTSHTIREGRRFACLVFSDDSHITKKVLGRKKF